MKKRFSSHLNRDSRAVSTILLFTPEKLFGNFRGDPVEISNQIKGRGLKCVGEKRLSPPRAQRSHLPLSPRAKSRCRLGITLFPREKPPRKRRNPWNLLLSTYCANGGLFASGRSGGRPARRIATSRATTNKLITKPATPAQPCRAQNHPPAVPSTLDPR
jgi:hypothetical protein